MKIEFKNICENEIENFKGGDKSFFMKSFSDDKMKIMEGRLEPGASIGLHTHQGSCEVIYVLEGCGTIIYEGEEFSLCTGECHYCPEGKSHSFKNTGDKTLKFLGIVPSF